jgi:pimeloyl-ACP methyl ester carboxylesterase
LASSPTKPEPIFFTAADGTRLAYYELGDPGARPVILIHGLFSNAWTNWIRYGHAAAIAATGRRVVMMDMRAHGRSGAPHDKAHYPADIVASDAAALIAHLGLSDFDLVGYSLGARTSVRLILGGANPGKLVLAGMGLTGLLSTDRRLDHFRHVLDNLGKHERGTTAWNAEAFLKTTKSDPVALRLLLDTFPDIARADLARLTMPTLVVAGEEDDDNGSAPDLAAALPDGRYAQVPGGHMSAVIKKELGQTIAAFLAA